MNGDLETTVERLRYVLANMQDVLAEIDGATPPSAAVLRVRIERWTQSIDSIVAGAHAHLNGKPTIKNLMAAAILGRDLSADAGEFSLRDLTQLAALMHAGCTLTVLNPDILSPIEQASIRSACPGQIAFATPPTVSV